jgi:hypothetical protein
MPVTMYEASVRVKKHVAFFLSNTTEFMKAWAPTKSCRLKQAYAFQI